MKKLITSALIFLLILTCFGCSNNSNNQSNNTNNSTDNSSNTSTTSSGTNTVTGDWKFEGDINGTIYDINLDLEANNEFELDVDEENTDDEIEAELNGTYTASNDVLTLDVVTLQNNSNYLTGSVLQNSQIELKYKLKDDKTLELSNASEYFTFIPAELTLNRDN